MTALKKSLAALTATVALGAASVVAGSTPASAAMPTGVVTASPSVVVRAAPTTNSVSYGSYKQGTKVPIWCKITGQSIGGNTTWYQLPSEGVIFVSGRYLKVTGTVPECAGNKAMRTVATGDVWVRTAPSTSDAKVRVLRKGAAITVLCGLDKAGSAPWYYTSDHRWVSGAYLKGLSTIQNPGTCTIR